MADKQSFVLYADYQPQIDRLGMEQRGVLLTAIFAHANGAEKPDMDATVDMAFAFIAAQLDRDKEKWGRIKASRAAAGRAGGIASGVTRNRDEVKEASASKTKETKQKKANEAVNVTVPVDVTVTVDESTGVTGGPPAAAPHTRPEDEKKRKHGTYGWVKLTEEQYSRLLNDLGETEVKRCIAYIDESAQATGNKNRWRDWNLILRRCHRDGWGSGTVAVKSQTRTRIEERDGEVVIYGG